jgi:predicted transcriptional regulator
MISQTRFKQLHNTLNAPVKKVYEAVPLAEAWTTTQIISEISRLGYSMRDSKAIIGCLDTLKRHGLITEPDRGSFIRVEVKETATINTFDKFIEETKEKTMATSKPVTQIKQTNLDRLINLSEKANTLAAQMKTMAAELENVALEIEAEIQENQTSAQKLKQLQDLLKGMA